MTSSIPILLEPEQVARLKMCFTPQSAAIIGASTDPMKFGGRALKFCLERGYQGCLYPVNAKNAVVQGVQAYASMADLPEAPEIVVIAVPAPLVRDNLIAAGQKGAKVAVVYGAQFAEAGEAGQSKQDDLLSIARQYNMRMIGPNCMGVISLASGFVASFTAAPEHNNGQGWPEVGTVSVASQSGAVGIQIFAQLRDRGLGLANWISTGNQADIDVADAIAYYASDPATKTIAVYMEDASRGIKLLQALELARQAQKPVVILKVGTTPQGGLAAQSHTASMYVEDRVVEDLFQQYGVLRARSINELIDLTAACEAGIIPPSNQVAAVSVSGGGAVMIADAAAQEGLELIEYKADALAHLKQSNAFVNDRNPIDISAPSMSNMAITGGHLKWGLEQNAPILMGYISHIPLVPRTRGKILPQLLEFTKNHPEQLVAIAMNAHPEDRKALIQTGMAVFDDPTVMTHAVGKLVRAGQAHQKPAQTPAISASTPSDMVDVRETLGQIGIQMVEEVVIDDDEQALALLEVHGALVLKLSAPSLKHRTELGAVKTHLSDEDDVLAALSTLQHLKNQQAGDYPGLEIVASPMITGVEVLVGVRHDPHFGPLVVCATGGIYTELFDDLVYRKSPISTQDAEEMLTATRANRLLEGWRGAEPVQRSALLQTLITLSEHAHRLPSLEINPLIVTSTGAVGVDLLIDG